MTGLLGFARVVDAINERIGKWVSWLVLAAVLVSAGNAIIRKVFSTSSNAWLELQWYLFGAVFMLGAAWTLRCNEHIRIDIVSSRFAKRARDKLDVFGHTVFLLPFVLLHIWTSWPFFLNSSAPVKSRQTPADSSSGQRRGSCCWASSCCSSRRSPNSSSASPF